MYFSILIFDGKLKYLTFMYRQRGAGCISVRTRCLVAMSVANASLVQSASSLVTHMSMHRVTKSEHDGIICETKCMVQICIVLWPP